MVISRETANTLRYPVATHTTIYNSTAMSVILVAFVVLFFAIRKKKAIFPFQTAIQAENVLAKIMGQIQIQKLEV